MFLQSLLQSTAHSSCTTVTLQLADNYLFKYEGPLEDLYPLLPFVNLK